MTLSRLASPVLVAAALLALVIVVFAGLGLAGVFSSGGDGKLVVNGQLTHDVERGPLVISFTERGSIKAASSVPIYCLLEGTSTIVSVVDEGTSVKEGELLVVLDSSNLDQLVNQQQISADSAKAALAQAGEEVIIQESLNKSDIDQAELDVDLAKIDLEKYRDGDHPLSEQQHLNAILLAEEDVTKAKDEYEWTKKLAARGYVNRLEEKTQELKVKRLEVGYTQAKGSLDLLEKYGHRREMMIYESALDQATGALERAKRRATAQMTQVKVAEKAAESTHRLSQQRLDKLKDQLSKTRIYAPQDGMVVYAAPQYRRGREAVIEQGGQVSENQTLMQLPDVSVMAVTVNVHESWVDQVEPGLPTRISLDALAGTELTGHVTKIGFLPDHVNRWLNPDLKVYKTEVTVDSDQDTSLLRPGMTAKVQIVIKMLADVLFVPVQSVTTLDRQQVCYRLDGGDFRPVPVTTGAHNESYIEIVSGLEEGDTIQLDAPSPEGGNDWEKLEQLEDVKIVRGSDTAESSRDASARRPGRRGARGGSRDDGGARRPGRSGEGAGGGPAAAGSGGIRSAAMREAWNDPEKRKAMIERMRAARRRGEGGGREAGGVGEGRRGGGGEGKLRGTDESTRPAARKPAAPSGGAERAGGDE
ncbi:MAG: efflux RND transporter periplasmic adaptor subunit [Planctomycetota bacterium]|nr:efflux RND transporter periplasmic adaptor subunit [Planctomycetota bacterium]